MPDNKNTPKHGAKQTDAAEGDRETIDESLRQHEKKGDLKTKTAGKTKH